MDIAGLYMPAWLFVVFALCILYVAYMSRNMLVFYRMGVEGPTPIPVLGNFHSYFRKGLIEAEAVWYKKYKSKVFGTHECSYPVLQIADREMMREILVKEFDKFANRRMTELIDKACDILVKNVEVKAESKEDFDLKEICGSYTMDVIANTAFGLEIDAQKNPDLPFIKNAKKFFEPSPIVVAILFFAPFIEPLLPTFVRMYLVGREHNKFFEVMLTQVINDRKKNMQEYKDILQSLLDNLVDDKEIKESPTSWSTKGLSEKEILAQSILFFMAGYETTATTLALTLYNLAIHPDLLEKAIAEVDEKLGKDNLDYEKTTELTYLEMCINENLRLHPPVSRFDRVASCDVTINGLEIKKGMLVAFPIHAIQRDPDIWEDPERFDPERFSPGNKSSIGPFDFMPFGYGPRNCIGLRLAYMEMKMAMAKILQHFRPTLCAKSQVPLKFRKLGLILQPEKGLWVRMERRD